MAEDPQIQKSLVHMAFLQRETGFSHHAYVEEMRQYELVREGDARAADEGARIFTGDKVGRLSDDRLRDKRYLFVAATTLATRYAIEGGLEPETAYTLSDLFIQRMDRCTSEAEIVRLHRAMMEAFASRVAGRRAEPRYSGPVLAAMEYIDLKLQQALNVSDVARHAGLSRSYLAVLFHREVGMPVSDYIRARRVKAAENMLLHSGFTLQQISDYLAFNSQSHFTSVFRAATGLTPRVYRETRGRGRA